MKTVNDKYCLVRTNTVLMLLSAQLFLLAAACEASQKPGLAERPNILMIIMDDVGWGDLGCYNPAGKIPTPSADRLARAGMRFTDAHTTSGVCSPSRYSLLTGNYPWRGRNPAGVWDYTTGSDMLPGQKTVGAILKDAGYNTAIFGKLGVGNECETKPGGNSGKPELDWTKPLKDGPCQWGFDYSYVLLQGHQGAPYMFFENGRVDGDISRIIEYPKPVLRHKDDLAYRFMTRGGPGLPDWDCRKVGESLIGKVEQFLDRHLADNKAAGKMRPFYIHLSTAGGHTPYMPPQAIRGTKVQGVSRMTAHTDMVVEADVVAGKLVELLKRRGLLADTMVVLTSDNGGIPGERSFGHDAVNGLKGGKSSVFEGGHRVPLIVRWGDGTPAGSRIPPGTVRQQMVAVHDMVATFAELARTKVGPNQAIDSISLAGVLSGKRGDGKPVRRTLISQSHSGCGNFGKAAKGISKAAVKNDNMAHSLRDGNWKLVFNAKHEVIALYDLAVDLYETRNLTNAPGQKERIGRMVKLYQEIRHSSRSSPVVPSE